MREPKKYSFKNLEYVGRLGNQLFQIAWTYTQAAKSGGKAYVNPDWSYRKIFDLPEELYEKPSGETIDGGTEYYQDLRFWHGMESEVRDLFSLSDYAKDKLLTYLGDGLSEGSCSIHYRRDDYLKHPGHFPIPTDRYYRTAIENALAEDSEVKFYVFSDSIDLIKEEYNSKEFYKDILNRTTFFEGNITPVEVEDRVGEPEDWLDMFAMASCDNHIIANSTFSWWGAFLSNDQNPIYPSKWFGNNPAVKEIPWKSMIPANWRQVKC